MGAGLSFGRAWPHSPFGETQPSAGGLAACRDALATETHATEFGSGKGGLCAIADSFGLLFGDQGHNANRQPVGFRHINWSRLPILSRCLVSVAAAIRPATFSSCLIPFPAKISVPTWIS